MSDVGKLFAVNPVPFKQPFLVLQMTPTRTTEGEWMVDVGGKINMYLTPRKDTPPKSEVSDLVLETTPLLKELCRELKRQGYPVYAVRTYKGSGGPGYILRHGAFFKRMEAGRDVPELPTWMDE